MANKVLLGVTGCIGAYKAAEILRGLQKQAVEVRVMMTRHATEFIAPLTFEALTGHPVITDMWERPSHAQIEHITLARWADVVLIAPATANCLAKFAHGIADDFLSTVYLSNTNPVFVAPAMNVEMWQHPATQANLAILQHRGVEIVAPGVGYQACGEIGAGRLAEPAEIVERILAFLRTSPVQDLQGEHVLITAGPTVEDLDPVRFITNRSSGKMGYAIAAAARARGARVTLVSGPTRLTPPDNVETIQVRATREMYDAVLERLDGVTAFIGCAAVADFRPANKAENKIKKLGRTNITLELETTEDIIATVGATVGEKSQATQCVIIGFAAESQELLDYAERKLREKGMHAIVANDITRQDAGFDVETNAATILRCDGSRVTLPLQSKTELAERVLDEIGRWRKVAPETLLKEPSMSDELPPGVQLASVSARFTAYLIDIIPLALLGVLVGYFFFGLDEVLKEYWQTPRNLARRARFLVYRNAIRDGGFIVYVLYGWVAEASSWQGTLGKRLCGIKVVDQDGDRLSWSRSLSRAGGKLLGFVPLFLGFLWALFRKDKRGWHDLMAKTYVVKREAGSESYEYTR